MSIQEEPTSDSDNEDKREDRLHHETGQSSELDNQNTDVEVNFFFFIFFASFFQGRCSLLLVLCSRKVLL